MKRPERTYEFIPTCKQAEKTFRVQSMFENDVVGVFDNSSGNLTGKEWIVEGEELPIKTDNKNQISLTF